MTGYLCPGCRIEQHGACAGNVDWYVAGYSVPAVRNRCGCTCCTQEVRGVCDRCGEPCTPATASQHRTCPLRLDPTLDTPTEASR